MVYIGILRGKKVAIKQKHPCSQARGRIGNEAKFLKILNGHGIGPTLICYERQKLVYCFVEGVRILDYLKSANRKQSINAIKKVFEQCFIMDQLGINKHEMTNPYKHVLVKKEPVQIDFERCNYSDKPKNVTQFCQFVSGGKVAEILKTKSIRLNRSQILAAAKAYKKSICKKRFEKLISLVN